MKYGESFFDILYLVFAILLGVRMLRQRKSAVGRLMGWAVLILGCGDAFHLVPRVLMGWAVLILGCGDAFHLVPRVLNYFVNADFSAWLGIGKLVTSITMTVFYVILYRLWLKVYKEKENSALSIAVYVLTALRVALCLMPQNRWFANESDVTWGIIRNVPFVLLGGLIVWLYFRNRNQDSRLRFIWLLVTLSFLFYIPVAVAAGIVPMLGMLMLPKTVCYMIMIWIFWKYPAK